MIVHKNIIIKKEIKERLDFLKKNIYLDRLNDDNIKAVTYNDVLETLLDYYFFCLDETEKK